MIFDSKFLRGDLIVLLITLFLGANVYAQSEKAASAANSSGALESSSDSAGVGSDESAASGENGDRFPAASSDVNDPNLAMKVKKKMYPGGSEEGDLKVQTQLVTPTRRFAPVQNQDPEAHEPASND